MNRMQLVRVTICVALLACVSLSGAAEADALKQGGLTRSDDVYVLADEKPVLDGMTSLRKTKLQADKETRARHSIEMRIAAKQRIAKDTDKEWHALETRLTLVQDVEVHNRIVLRMNRLVADHKEAVEAQKDLEDEAGKVSTTGKTQFVDDLLALNAKSDAVSQKYESLAKDDAVISAIAKANAAAASKARLGPSPAFTAASEDLKKWQSAIDSEAIPLREESGIHLVDVWLNGDHFLMGVDTGASAISLPAEVAEKLKMVPGEQDPTVELSLADGRVIEGKEMSLKTVRVGRFTLNDVSCVVLQPGLNKAPVILGGSFLNHFVVKLDPAANELHLTQIKEESPARIAPAVAK